MVGFCPKTSCLWWECVSPAAAQIENMARACFYFSTKLAIQRGNKASFINIYGRAACEWITKRATHQQAALSVYRQIAVLLYAFLRMRLLHWLRNLICVLCGLFICQAHESVNQFCSGVRWRSTFGLWFMNFPPHRPGSDFGHANRRPQQTIPYAHYNFHFCSRARQMDHYRAMMRWDAGFCVSASIHFYFRAPNKAARPDNEIDVLPAWLNSHPLTHNWCASWIYKHNAYSRSHQKKQPAVEMNSLSDCDVFADLSWKSDFCSHFCQHTN